jgi:hypothetical protein
LIFNLNQRQEITTNNTFKITMKLIHETGLGFFRIVH